MRFLTSEARKKWRHVNFQSVGRFSSAFGWGCNKEMSGAGVGSVTSSAPVYFSEIPLFAAGITSYIAWNSNMAFHTWNPIFVNPSVWVRSALFMLCRLSDMYRFSDIPINYLHSSSNARSFGLMFQKSIWWRERWGSGRLAWVEITFFLVKASKALRLISPEYTDRYLLQENLESLYWSQMILEVVLSTSTFFSCRYLRWVRWRIGYFGDCFTTYLMGIVVLWLSVWIHDSITQ